MKKQLIILFFSLCAISPLAGDVLREKTSSPLQEDLLPNVREEVDGLLNLIKDRLIIMHDVAKWKWNQKAPIEDVERERQLLQEFSSAAIQAGIDNNFATAFLQAQMDAAKLVQKRDFECWHAEEKSFFEEIADLKTEIRPALDQITQKMIFFLNKISAHPWNSAYHQFFNAEAALILNGFGIDLFVREVALRPFMIKERLFSPVENSPIIVQTSRGSFNHQAINYLFQKNVQNLSTIEFGGSHLQTFEMSENKGLAFVALKNSAVPGNLIPSAIEALEIFHVEKVLSAVRMKIEMSLIRHIDAMQLDIPLQKIASHPAALLQIHHWKLQHPCEEIIVNQGTAEAARLLSSGALELNTAVIGSKQLVLLYPNLVAVEKNIQDTTDNFTLFALLQVSKLATGEKNNSRKKLQAVIDEIETLFPNSLSLLLSSLLKVQ